MNFRTHLRLVLCASAILVAAPGALRAAVFDFPLRQTVSNEPWLRGEPIEWEDFGIRRVEFPLKPIEANTLLVVTVIFEERDGRRIRALWNTGEMLGVEIASNLQEGIFGWNQRTFFVPPELLTEPGNLVIESEGSSRIVHRVAVQLLRSTSAFAPPARAGDTLALTDSGFGTLRTLDLTTNLVSPDAWFGNMIEAWLQDAPEPAAEGVEFLVEIRPAPRRAVLRFEWNGRGSAPRLAVNGRPVQQVNIEVPSLKDPAYIEQNGSLFYAGWRKGWAMLPENVLTPGDNSFVFFGESAQDYVRGARVEMWFDEKVAPAPGSLSLLDELNLDHLPTADADADSDFPRAWNPDIPSPPKTSEPLTHPAPIPASLPNLFRTSIL